MGNSLRRSYCDHRGLEQGGCGTPLGLWWKTEGTWKGRANSLVSTLERAWTGDDAVNLHFFQLFLFFLGPEEYLLKKKKNHPRCGHYYCLQGHTLKLNVPFTRSCENVPRTASFLLSFVRASNIRKSSHHFNTYYWGPTLCSEICFHYIVQRRWGSWGLFHLKETQKLTSGCHPCASTIMFTFCGWSVTWSEPCSLVGV